MRRLKDRLAKTDSKFNKEKSRSMRKLKLIVDALEEKQVWKDHALMAAVEQLVITHITQYSVTDYIMVSSSFLLRSKRL